jgi:solute carrier family 12 sodium/potassium/chloride transporter 2
MTSLEEVFSSSPTSNDSKNHAPKKQTEMADVSPRADNDSFLGTPPEPEPEPDEDALAETKENAPDPAPPYSENEPAEEEKDSLYESVAPKQPVQQQMEQVVQAEAVPAADVDADREVAANDNLTSDSDPHNYLKSTLKKNQRAWVDPWEAAVQDTFYHKQIETLRPTFDIVSDQIRGMESLENLFDAPVIYEADHEVNVNPDDIELEEEEKAMAQPKQQRKFGPWDGVMAGCLLNIFGVIMFLRVGFVVGQAGIIGALVIMSISAVVTVLTALSMSAICTNGTILAGGAYYIISRALGPSIGGAIGILFSLGNMVACSMYLIGFAETLVANLYDAAGFQIFADPVMDVRIWSNVVLCLVLILAIVGLKYVIKAQLGLLAFIVCAIILFFAGSFYKKVYTENGLVITPAGWVNGNFRENLGSGYDDGFDFWGVLAIFFPAVTGIMAGANISGDLRNPSMDIPKGTLTAIVISTIVYMIMAVFVGAVTVRYELLANELVMSLVCVWEYIVLIGIYAATLSSAIASLVGAPRILQAVANDNLFPFKALTYFAKADKDGNPIRGYFLSFGVAFCCNLIGALNAIAPLISQFFMLTYLLINFACFSLTISKSPGWRPSFKYFNKYTAGCGSLVCLCIMFLLNYAYALFACLIALLLFLYVEWTEPEVNWGAAPQARKYYNAYKAILKLRKTKRHIKNWRPGLLVLVRDPIKRAQMMLFAQTLKKGHGPIFYATVHTGDYRTNIRKFHEAHSLGYLPLNAPKNSKGFYESVLAETLRQGVQNLFQLVGMGSLRPNTLIIGYKRKWVTDSDEVINEYVQILRDTLVMGMGLMIACGFKRVNWFLDSYAPPALQHDIDDFPEIYAGGLSANTKNNIGVNATTRQESGASQSNDGEGGKVAGVKGKTNNLGYGKLDHIRNVSPVMSMPRNQEQEDAAIFLSSAWAAGQGKDTVIDVWWMIDDGGLCMLVPYIMKLHKFWQRCKLRMLMVSEEDSIDDGGIHGMKVLIDQFRLPYYGPLLVPARKEPHPKTVQVFESLAGEKLSATSRPSVIQKWLILSELLFEYSRYSGLNVVTLPIPTKQIKPKTYMALLHMLSDQERLPPTIIMRGNGESTLTYYSE